jgi:hypothetical protein
MHVKLLIVAAVICVSVGGGPASAEPASSRATSTISAPIVLLVDSTGKVAARALNDTMMLVTVHHPAVVAPAFIHPVYDADGRAASGLATWASDGSVLFTSPDCSSGAHVFGANHAGLRATSQVATPGGTILYVGAIATTRSASIQSILYGSGCSAVMVQQNGLIPVDLTINLTTAYPPPLSFQ